MKTIVLGMMVLLGANSYAQAGDSVEKAQVGKLAPAFSGKTVDGKNFDFKPTDGKITVLEWNNPECPFVVRHYSSGNMQKLQETYQAKGIRWVTINSSVEGAQGYMTSDSWKKLTTAQKPKSNIYFLDHNGSVGRMYEAKTTPHMYVIDAKGVLVYAGAIDDKPSTREPASGEKVTNYVSETLDRLIAGNTVEPYTKVAYGCGVKYKK